MEFSLQGIGRKMYDIINLVYLLLFLFQFVNRFIFVEMRHDKVLNIFNYKFTSKTITSLLFHKTNS